MDDIGWRTRSQAGFTLSKQPVTASRGMVVTNHPQASAAGVEILAAGGNAVDAAVAGLFALTVAEPMMIGLLGGGLTHIRVPGGEHVVIDGMSTAPAAATPGMYRTVSDTYPLYMETEHRQNSVGATAVAVPGNLLVWAEALRRFGTMPLHQVMQPAIHLAARGFRVTPYLHAIIGECAADLACDPEMSKLYLPGGAPLPAGARLIQSDYAETLRHIARDGPGCLHGGALGATVAAAIQAQGGLLSQQDLASYQIEVRQPVIGRYRGHQVLAPPPPAPSGVHIIQMLNIIEGLDVAGMGFGSAELLHVMAETMAIAFADRSALPPLPPERLTSKDYAAERRAGIDMARAHGAAAAALPESGNTTHLTVADAEGFVVAATHTINSAFGARIMLPGTGLIPNNYMNNFDPHPGRALSIAPGRRIPTSMSPLIVLRDGRPVFALGLPGGLRIFPSAFQAVLNLLDHGMSLQEAVEAPRLWTQGEHIEAEPGFPPQALQRLRQLGHVVKLLPHVGGGMNAIQFGPDGMMTGAACWRADGVPAGTSGGYARANARFWPEGPPPGALDEMETPS